MLSLLFLVFDPFAANLMEPPVIRRSGRQTVPNRRYNERSEEEDNIQGEVL